MLMVGFRGGTPQDSSKIRSHIQHYNVGGVILFSRDLGKKSRKRNIIDSTQLKTLTSFLQAAASTPLLIAVDQEGGRVVRLGAAFGLRALPSAQYLGKHAAKETIETSLRMAEVLHAHGINLNLAPSVDVAPTAGTSILSAEGRLFSSDPADVARYARAFIHGHRQAHVLCAIKHFPGLGSAQSDSHFGLPDISTQWSQRDLHPFRSLFSDHAVDMVMVAHVMQRELDAVLPATLSPAIVGGLLRNKLQYNGVVISDALEMGAISTQFSLRERVRLAILAGVDMLLFANNRHYDSNIVQKVVGIIVELLQKHEVSVERIRASLKRIEELKKKLGVNLTRTPATAR